MGILLADIVLGLITSGDPAERFIGWGMVCFFVGVLALLIGLISLIA